MKRFTLRGIIILFFLSLSNTFVFATSEDNQLVDALEELERTKTEQELATLQESFTFDTFSSCEDMTTVLENFIKDNFKDVRYGRGGGWFGDDIAIFEEAAMPTPSPTNTVKVVGDAVDDDEVLGMGGGVDSSTIDYSSTNLQVVGVDEADIIKTDGEYIYYYNQKNQEVSILQSPLDRDTATIDLADAEIVKIINLPQTFWGTQMYIQDNKLILIAQRWNESGYNTFIDRNNRTNVVVYDVRDVENPELIKLSDLDGNYHDSRMIGDTLYVVSQLYVNRWYPVEYFGGVDDVVIEADSFLPKTIDVAYTADATKRNLTIGNITYPYHVSIERPDCANIQYILPSKETIAQHGLYPNFTIVRAIDIEDTDEAPTTATSFGSTQTIHMSNDNLYLTNPLYVAQAFTCPSTARCILPWYEGGQHTLIHKFGLEGTQVQYRDSNIVMGTPLSQYSMSEDARGNFRLLTSSWGSTTATHLFILDDALDLEGMLLNIEPGEEFKSSRYIGNKLYLVTFERTDPLFVIDLEDTRMPEIIGELKIPGFSTYLHPYAAAADGKQYLLGLGYDTTENAWGGIVTNGIKLDLYEIDYTTTDDEGYVSTKQLYTQTWGEEQSYSEALDNPRMFVWDEKRQLLVLPMVLASAEEAQNCSIQYNANGEEISRQCWDDTIVDTTFAGLKAIEVDIQDGITERYSYDFLDRLKTTIDMYEEWNGAVYPWQFTQLQWRAGYLGDVLYTFNNAFAHFALMDKDQEIYVDFEMDR